LQLRAFRAAEREIPAQRGASEPCRRTIVELSPADVERRLHRDLRQEAGTGAGAIRISGLLSSGGTADFGPAAFRLGQQRPDARRGEHAAVALGRRRDLVLALDRDTHQPIQFGS
jgi:hypothetical protein